MKKLIIIPAYNESECIEATIHDIIENAPDFDYVIINDCSTDDTRAICERNNFNIVNLPINLGIGGAVQTGYMYAMEYGYDLAVQVDGDGQHDPQFLRQMAEYLETHDVDMVIGSRFIEKEGFQTSSLRRFGIKFLNGLIRLVCGVKVTDATSGFRAVSRRLIVIYGGEYPTDYPEPEAIVMAKMHKMKIKEIPVVMRDRSGGQSSIKFLNSVYYMIKVSIAIMLRRLQ